MMAFFLKWDLPNSDFISCPGLVWTEFPSSSRTVSPSSQNYIKPTASFKINKMFLKKTYAWSLSFLALLSVMIPPTEGFCPNSCSCNDDILTVSCVESNLDVLPITLNPSIRRLVMRYNKIRTIDAAFQFYGELQYVDISYNQLVNIPRGSFESQKKLLELHLNFNKISNINNRTFVGLRVLTVLNLRGNFLETLDEKLFAFLPKLEVLDLGQNRIYKIHPSAFEGLSSLRVLNIDDNQLLGVPTTSFHHLTNLFEFNVGYNALNSLPANVFEPLEKLSVLDCRGASIANVSEDAFHGIGLSLRVLKLSDNHLTSIPTNSFDSLGRLEELFLGQNPLVTIPAFALKGLSKLKVLDISGCMSLSRIDREAFAVNLDLEEVRINNNKKLDSLEEETLSLPNLKRLSLSGNHFETVKETWAPWTNLKVFNLNGNPIECNCELKWLQELLIVRNQTEIHCHSPLNFKDKPLNNPRLVELSCGFIDTSQHIAIVVASVVGLCIVAALVFFIYRYRKRNDIVCSDYQWNGVGHHHHQNGVKNHLEYEKTYTDDEYIYRAAQQQTLKPIPITEL